MKWRDVMKVTADRTLTMNDLKSIRVGDYLVPVVEGFDPQDTEKTVPLFKQGKPYEVLEVTLPGIVIESEKGNWWVDFSQGFGKFFTLKKLNNDEKLGLLGSLPFEIMKLLSEHGSIFRTRIITAIMQIYYTDDTVEMKELRDDTINSISLLLRTGKIEYGDTVGLYKLTPEGLKEMWEGGETNIEKYEKGVF